VSRSDMRTNLADLGSTPFGLVKDTQLNAPGSSPPGEGTDARFLARPTSRRAYLHHIPDDRLRARGSRPCVCLTKPIRNQSRARVAPIPQPSPNHNAGAPGPSLLGTGDDLWLRSHSDARNDKTLHMSACEWNPVTLRTVTNRHSMRRLSFPIRPFLTARFPHRAGEQLRRRQIRTHSTTPRLYCAVYHRT
jgi:hypothetical protein